MTLFHLQKSEILSTTLTMSLTLILTLTLSLSLNAIPTQTATRYLPNHVSRDHWRHIQSPSEFAKSSRFTRVACNRQAAGQRTLAPFCSAYGLPITRIEAIRLKRSITKAADDINNVHSINKHRICHVISGHSCHRQTVRSILHENSRKVVLLLSLSYVKVHRWQQRWWRITRLVAAADDVKQPLSHTNFYWY